MAVLRVYSFNVGRLEMQNSALIQSLVGGLLVILGGFFGAWLARRTEYEKWLRQQRSTEFGSFLHRLYEVRLEASNAIYSSEGTEQSRSIAANELFIGLRQHESVARLYMSKTGRKKISNLMNDLWENCTAKGGPATRTIKIKEIEADVQALIEGELERLPWSFRWPF